MSNNDIYHFGVKGMHWGVRKDRSSGGSKRGSKGKASKDPKSTAGKGASKVGAILKNPTVQKLAITAALTVGAHAANKSYQNYMSSVATQNLDVMMSSFLK